MAQPFVPDTFTVPQVLETLDFRLRMLTVADTEKDFEAVMTSAERLRNTFPQWQGWPREGFTLPENRADLQRHQAEFERREAFAYTVVSLDESQVLGCVYLYPRQGELGGAEVLMWVRESQYEQGLDPILFAAVKSWLAHDWPFRSVIYPGRPDSVER